MGGSRRAARRYSREEDEDEEGGCLELYATLISAPRLRSYGHEGPQGWTVFRFKSATCSGYTVPQRIVQLDAGEQRYPTMPRQHGESGEGLATIRTRNGSTTPGEAPVARFMRQRRGVGGRSRRG